MVQQHFAAATAAPYDLTRIIKQVEREIAAGLDVNDNAAVAAFAKQIERELLPRIIPDRCYSIPELVEKFGYTRGLFYKRRKHLIRKDGRKSFVLGRELLADIEAAPTLAPAVPAVTTAIAAAAAQPRRRGRPRKVMVESKPAVSSDAA
jgi:hypothetical protein